MSKLIVKICSGTTCYVMGASELFLLGDTLPVAVAERIEIRGAPCLDCCNRPELGKAPFVVVGETLVTSATMGKVVDEINKQLSHGGNQ